jgi:hypothetical protein
VAHRGRFTRSKNTRWCGVALLAGFFSLWTGQSVHAQLATDPAAPTSATPPAATGASAAAALPPAPAGHCGHLVA